MYRYDSITYINNPLVEQNPFRSMPQAQESLPDFASARNVLPQPSWAGHQSTIDCYWKSWELAFAHLLRPTADNGFVSNYLETAFNGHLFMWDSAFALQFGKHGRRAFDFLRTLDDLYAKQHPDGFICRELDEANGMDCFQRHDPCSTGPNVMAWTEWDWFAATGDAERLGRVFPGLAAYHQWLKLYRTWPDGSHWSSGWGCGLDNLPRQRPEGVDVTTPKVLERFRAVFHGHMSWVDACLQQVLSAKRLVQMARVLGREPEVALFQKEIDFLTTFVNKRMWDERSAFYYDIFRDGTRSDVMTVLPYWALLADIVPEDRLDRFLAHLSDPREFNRPHRVPALAADHPEYHPQGNYWQGGVWPPTTYMVLCGLEQCGRHNLAHEIGRNHVENVVRVFEKTGTVWENYAPESAAPGNDSRPDLVGWSALGPIAVLLEHVFGIAPDPAQARLVWRIRLVEEHGVKNYPFGRDGLVDLHCRVRARGSDRPVVTAGSNQPLKLEIIWPGGREDVNVEP